MDYLKLGSSDLSVSRICLGSMTWGLQNNQQDADAQIKFAQEQGVNFIDTAEMYAVPPSPDTYGKTEAIIGDYLSRHQHERSNWIIASKIAGPGLNWVRGGSEITKAAIEEAINGSLARLNTDYIDVYQLHWPNRTSPHFGKHAPNNIQFSNVDASQQSDSMLAILEALDEAIRAGKIRSFGLSNETPWGINRYLSLATKYNLPKPVSIQNEFNLLHSKDWPYLIENCVHEEIAYLPWSPLAGGMLTGKYLNGARPTGTRWTISQRNGLFRDTALGQEAVANYCELAARYNITPSQLALAWVNKVDGVTSTIIGATTLPQLAENIAAFDLVLPDEFFADVNAIWQRYAVPF